MNEILTHIDIAAGAKEVWKVLTDFERYPEWNTLMWPDGGDIRPGARLRVRVRIARWIRFSFRPTIHKADPGRGFSWKGRLPARLLQGVHSFAIESLSSNRVRFIHRETFTGLMVPFYMWLMAGWAERAYARMNRELKARTENIYGQSGQAVSADTCPLPAPTDH